MSICKNWINIAINFDQMKFVFFPMMYHQWVEYKVCIGSKMSTGEEKTRIEILRKKISNVGLIGINDILISWPGRIGQPIPGNQQETRLWSSAGPLYRSAARRSRRSCRGWGWCTLTVTSFSGMLLVVRKQLKLPHFQILSIFTWMLGWVRFQKIGIFYS